MSNRLKSTRFRELVTLYFQLQGIDTTAKPDNHGQLSEAIRYEGEVGDVHGVENWLVNVRNEGTRDLSGALDEAHRDAKIDEKKHAAVVFHRSSRGVGEHYVLISLADFASALAGGQK